MLLMFYTVESQLRERTKKLAPIFLLLASQFVCHPVGKITGQPGVVWPLLRLLLSQAWATWRFRERFRSDGFPFAAYWLFLLMPTYIFWAAFITLMIVLTRNRYTTYAIGAVALFANLYLGVTGELTWATNWMLDDLSPWSDISIFEIDRSALFLNRLLYISLGVLFFVLAARLFWRRGNDSVQLATRLKPKPIAFFALKPCRF